MSIVVASGHFAPLHKGHLLYLEAARKLGDKLVVIVNTDKQIRLRGSKSFMGECERLSIVQSLRYVDLAVLSMDEDLSVNETLCLLYDMLGGVDLFVNGGDVQSENDCRESFLCKELGIDLMFGVGGSQKVQSSRILRGE
jgi:cytidyltransferase-like protein